MPVEIVGMPTVRESDGLAMSSRNGYLSVTQRAAAPLLYRTLQTTAEAIRAGDEDYNRLEAQAQAALQDAGFRPDYYAIRRAGDLAIPGESEGELVILAAVYLGTTRLIDNLQPVNRP
jgi:pantoate--beta-alanine ligase